MRTETVLGQLAVDVHETKESLLLRPAPPVLTERAGHVSISDNQLIIRGTLSAGNEDG